MKKKQSYIGIAFIILLFGIYTVPKVVARFSTNSDLTFLYTDDVIPEKRKVPEFEFINQYGKTITNKYYDGKVYVVEFFFSTCPSICPIMNKKLVTIQNDFLMNPNFGIASISITPEIDTPEILKDYAQLNGITHPNWNLLTGKPEEVVYSLAKEGFKLYAGKGDEDHGGFEHSGNFALIDKQGYIRSRELSVNNPLIYYNGIVSEKEGVDDEGIPEQISMLKEDIAKLLKE